jgi:hypothetical protein
MSGMMNIIHKIIGRCFDSQQMLSLLMLQNISELFVVLLARGRLLLLFVLKGRRTTNDMSEWFILDNETNRV